MASAWCGESVITQHYNRMSSKRIHFQRKFVTHAYIAWKMPTMIDERARHCCLPAMTMMMLKSQRDTSSHLPRARGRIVLRVKLLLIALRALVVHRPRAAYHRPRLGRTIMMGRRRHLRSRTRLTDHPKGPESSNPCLGVQPSATAAAWDLLL